LELPSAKHEDGKRRDGVVETLNLGIHGLDEVELIGRGGSSRVFRAKQIELDRLIALKVLKAGDDPNVVRRFDRERKAMGRLSLNEGIVPVYSSGLTDHGEPYLIMPYYEHGSLQDRINEGPLPWQEAVRFIGAAAKTMRAAHEAGVVHLDLKPANILLTDDDSPRIADFGIAKLVNDPNSSAFNTGAAFTPTFSAPEVLMGGSAAPTADVYGLAATLWSLISGRPPFRAENGEENTLMAVVSRVVHQPIDNLRAIAPDPICTVIETGMAKNPDLRYPTAGDFAQALSHAVAASRGWRPPIDGSTAAMDPYSPPVSGRGPSSNGTGSLQFDEAVPPRFVPAQEVTTGPTNPYSLLLVVAAAALAAILLLVGLRTLTGSETEGPSASSSQIDDQSVESSIPTVPVSSGLPTVPPGEAGGDPADSSTSSISTTTPSSTTSESTTTTEVSTTSTQSTTTTTTSTTSTTSTTTTTSSSTSTSSSVVPVPLDPPTSVNTSLNVSNEVVITWTPPTDTDGLRGYTIFRDGGPLFTTTGTGSEYTDTAPTPGATHIYRVRADARATRPDRANSTLSAPSQISIPN
jgi:serine/threonine protein kinase